MNPAHRLTLPALLALLAALPAPAPARDASAARAALESRVQAEAALLVDGP